MSSSIKDVAQAAGVSIASVSRVLSNKPYIRSELRERVMKAVEELDYRPNRVARSLRNQQSNTIGLIVADIRNPFFSSLSRAVEDKAYREGVNVFLCNTDEDPHKETIYLNLMRDENVAGVIFSPTETTAKDFNSLSLGYPVVIVDRKIKGGMFDSVLINNEEASCRLTAHLIRNGYRQIGALFGSLSWTGAERRQGFERALRENGLALNPAWVKLAPSQVEAGYSMAKAMLQAKDRPDAILTGNNLLTVGALMAVRDLGLSIPADVALAGFDDIVWNTLVSPGITVIAQPTYEIGETATGLLLERIQASARPVREVILSGELIVRGSSSARV
jgi:LacI family fructose operon transcriptional repressor